MSPKINLKDIVPLLSNPNIEVQIYSYYIVKLLLKKDLSDEQLVFVNPVLKGLMDINPLIKGISLKLLPHLH